VLMALFEAGAGTIGDYEHCTFTSIGTGQFRPKENADPFIGKTGETRQVKETRIEVIFENYKWSEIKKALDSSHPYEEVAFFITLLGNLNQKIGSGMIGTLEKAMSSRDFLKYLKSKMSTNTIKYTTGPNEIQRVAVCGGSGSFLIGKAKAAGAHAFVTGDIKYHEFFDAETEMLLADIGHYESEVFTKDLILDLLTKKFTTFAVNLSETDTNPINYF